MESLYMHIESNIAVLETAMFGKVLRPHMQASIPKRATEGAKSDTYGCPLCNCGADSEEDIYCHLLVSHRKSALVDALLERVDSDELARV
ncbi:hypothetical protein GCM10022627_04140 [Haloarcula argentinensis]